MLWMNALARLGLSLCAGTGGQTPSGLCTLGYSPVTPAEFLALLLGSVAVLLESNSTVSSAVGDHHLALQRRRCGNSTALLQWL